MNRKVFIRSKAERDLEKARAWYDEREPGLGDRLIQEAYATVNKLADGADRFSVYYRNLRRINLPTFPYRYFFRIEGNYVTVLRFLHSKRDHPRHLRH